MRVDEKDDAIAAILILEFSLKAARLWRAAFRLQSREFVPEGHELSALKNAIANAFNLPQLLIY